MRRLEGRVCVVTGAASGIGRAVASAMAAEGGRVVGFDVRETPADAAWSLVCDVTDVRSVERAVDAVHARHGRVDVLVNVAGIHRAGSVSTTLPQDWDAVLAVNLRGPYLVSRAVLPHMLRQGLGAIVHIASVAGLMGGRDSAAYIASKGGVIALTKAMAIDHAEQGIRVNCVCPGMIRTSMLARTEAGLDGEALRRLQDERAARHPLGRVGDPADVIPAVLYLASDDSSWVTGSILTVDGGYTAG
jgi:NAD(P)-dependent dehydrogenase (short-subunit alcohol dehydrogenase family)